MKIKNISCKQFAGINRKNVDFSDGVNIILGDNETGKSTLIDLMYHLFFTNAQLKGNDNAAKEFEKKYLPIKSNGVKADYVDGEISFTHEADTYILSKKWKNQNYSTDLTLPNLASIDNVAEIDRIMKEILSHGAGVYSEIVFPSQKRTQIILESILKSIDEKQYKDVESARREFYSLFKNSVWEADGIAISSIEKYISDEIAKLEPHWDISADAPEKDEKGNDRDSLRNKWTQNNGSVVKAYYKLKEELAKYKEITDKELELESINDEILDLKKQRDEAQKKRDEFVQFKAVLKRAAELADLIKLNEKKIDEYEKAAKEWPTFKKAISSANKIKKMLENAEIRRIYEELEPVYHDWETANTEFEAIPDVKSEIKKVESNTKAIDKQKTLLAGMNLTADIKMLAGNTVEVVSLETGKEYTLNGKSVSINEAAKIVIPDVAEITLMPQGIDADAVTKKIAELENEVREIFDKHGVGTIEELQDIRDKKDAKKTEKDELKLEVDRKRGDWTWNKISKAYSKLPADLQSDDDINFDKISLCGNLTVEQFIAKKETLMGEYVTNYETPEKLQELIKECKEKIKEAEEEIKKNKAVTDQFANVNPDQYSSKLDSDVKKFEDEIQSKFAQRGGLASQVGECNAEEYKEHVDEAQETFDEEKGKLAIWKKISEEFNLLKQIINTNPLSGFANSFGKYIDIISGGKMNVASVDETMEATVNSGVNSLKVELLSEGAKDTIGLAFRLAMLEGIFPNGNGFAVFDDSLADLDPKRLEQAVKLIEEFAKNNQVIFVTCDPKYRTLFSSANVIDYK